MRPRCPNHDVETDPTSDPRVWICPISSARFEFDVDTDEAGVAYDKYGRPMHQYTLVSSEEN